MKHIFLNLKRFDIPKKYGGVNQLAPIEDWANYIIEQTQDKLCRYPKDKAEFVMFFPELHLLQARKAKKEGSNIQLGSQGIFREDTKEGGNFGAFTTNITANIVKEAGCSYTLIGHCEERKDKREIIEAGRGMDFSAVHRLLNREIKMAVEAGLSVLYCIGESQEEQENWKEVLREQIVIGLEGIDKKKVVLAYEPIWAIGPGKVPPTADYIKKIAEYVKEITEGMDMVYGGGLKEENAEMLAGIEDIDGGLIALTRFQGEIGFYPEEYLKIIELYLTK